MNLKMCAVYDRAMGAFMRPIFCASTGMAVRSFMDEVSRPESEMGKHPADYELWSIGEFEDVNGTFVQLDKVRLCVASDFVGGNDVPK